MIVEECLKCVIYPSRREGATNNLYSTRWAAQRRVFGKPLLAQAVIRAK